MRVVFDIGEASEERLNAALEALTRIDESILAHDGPLPSLYESGVYYAREPELTETCATCLSLPWGPGARRDEWDNILTVLRRGNGDCEDLACWRTAELRRGGERSARAFATRSGPHTWHIRVMRANGQVEDPSRLLGMGPEADDAAGVAGEGGRAVKISFRIDPDGQGGWIGELQIPTATEIPASMTMPALPEAAGYDPMNDPYSQEYDPGFDPDAPQGEGMPYYDEEQGVYDDGMMQGPSTAPPVATATVTPAAPSASLIRVHPASAIVTRGGGKTREDALHHAAHLADAALKNPLVQALLPPGTAAAVAAIKNISGSREAKALYQGVKSLASLLPHLW